MSHSVIMSHYSGWHVDGVMRSLAGSHIGYDENGSKQSGVIGYLDRHAFQGEASKAIWFSCASCLACT